MNFLDAVRELKEGRCEGIELKSQYIKIREIEIGCISFMVQPETILAEDWELVNPKPRFEEVEIVKYVEMNECEEGKSSKTPFTPLKNMQLVKLTGTMKREIKPKVKHRVLIDNELFISETKLPFANNAKYFAEWEE
jgi:hypothetical protein